MGARPAAAPFTAHRVLVHGVTGSGKSTLAAAIAASTGLPWHDVDQLTWEPEWVPVSEAEQRKRFQAICADQRWVLDTAYRSWNDIPLARTDLVVGLDYPRWVSLARLLRRTAARIVGRRLFCNGNRETLRSALGRDSIVRWHFSTFASQRATIRRWATSPTGPPVVVLRSPAATRRWLDSLGQDGP